MADVFSKSKRSEIMSRVKSKGNLTTETRMIKIFREHHITGWRRHLKNVYGCPDFSWPSRKIAVFVDGCFWHGCPRCYGAPKINKEFWEEKILKNMARDRKVNRKLRCNGWHVIRVWECRLRTNSETVLRRIKKALDAAIA